ncbi:hypothetical protein VTJ49DRAFT_2969 [Mycothermus thermophilus]|uniref:Uncharacterized protein n=1 Tax=Humicola insolens TaxID=85995 RepID=A0ABR3V8R4_HUMIN
MAATIFRLPITPLPTPAPTANFGRGPVPRFVRRFENGTVTTASPTSSPGPNSAAFNALHTCSSSGDYGSCLASNEAAYCNCNNGMRYLDCVGAAVTGSTDAGVDISDWGAYERGWFQSSCPKPPSNVMAQLEQPSSVQLDLEPVSTVLPTGPISEPPRPGTTATYTPGGELLAGECSSTSYTLLNGGDFVFYAAVVGCDAGRPQCCPWNVAEQDESGVPAENRAIPGEFPNPASAQDSKLDGCPQDYYSISGKCCPKESSSGYYKFTREIAQQTPCFSSLATTENPPPVTAGLSANPTQSNLPTSAVVNLAIAMAFDVEDPAPTLSQAAIIGIGVGSGIAALIIVAASSFLFVRWRRHKKETSRNREPAVGMSNAPDIPDIPDMRQGTTYQSGYHAPVEAQEAAQNANPFYVEDPGAWEAGYQYGSGYHAPASQQPSETDHERYYRL